MNRYQKAIRYTKPLTEIDEKIDRLNEMMTTTGMYTVVTVDPGRDGEPPVYGKIPDESLGDFSDLDSFTQNADTDDVSQLSAENSMGTSVPITEVQDTSSFDFASGVSARAMARHGRTETGVVYGFIDSQNVFNEIFVIGGLRPSGRGESNIIDAGLDWWEANVEGKTIETVGWKCYNVPRLQDALYTPIAQNVGPGGNYMLHTNSLLFVKNENFMISGQSARPRGVPQVVSRNDLGDPNYYAGPINILLNIGRGVADFGQGLIEFVSGMTGPGAVSGGGLGPMPPLPPPPPEDSPPPPPPPEDTPPPPPPEDTPPPPEDEDDDRPLIPLGYDENGNPTGFTRLSPPLMEQFRDGGGDAALREGKTLNEVLQQGHENRKNAVTGFVDGVNDGITLVKDVNQTINDAKKNGDIELINGEPYIRDGAEGSKSNPIETNLSDSARSELINYLRNYDADIRGIDNLQSVVNEITKKGLNSSDGHLGLKGTHNNVTGEPYFDEAGNLHIPDTYGFGGSDDIRDKWGGSVGVVSDVLEYTGNSLGEEGWGNDFETYMDEAGPVGDAVELLTGEPLPGKNDPIVHFETVITADELAGSSLGNESNPFNKSEVKESTLFEKWKKKSQKKPEPKPDKLKLIYNYFYYLPKAVKKMVLMDMKVEAQIMMLPPNERSFREKELRNTLINKHHEMYMDEKFPENVEQTSRVKKMLAKNIELSDPKTFKDPKPALTYGKVFGDDPKEKKVKEKDFSKKSAGRFLKTEKKVDTSRTRWLKG